VCSINVFASRTLWNRGMARRMGYLTLEVAGGSVCIEVVEGVWRIVLGQEESSLQWVCREL